VLDRANVVQNNARIGIQFRQLLREA
jgi:hypothetical protein